MIRARYILCQGTNRTPLIITNKPTIIITTTCPIVSQTPLLPTVVCTETLARFAPVKCVVRRAVGGISVGLGDFGKQASIFDERGRQGLKIQCKATSGRAMWRVSTRVATDRIRKVLCHSQREV